MPSYEYMITNCDVINSDECVSRVHMFCKCKQKDSRSGLHLQKSGCRIRDREPSRVSLRKVICKLRCRKLRKKNKKMLKNAVPVSSDLHSIAAKYKQWNIRYIQKQDSFFSKYFLTSKRSTVTYNVSYKHILLSGDIESNPGPVSNNRTICDGGSNSLLNYRLLRYQLRPLDVGGGGDCFFRSVSHQLYGDSSHHHEVRAAGVQYLRDNPERFIESIVDTPWLRYISYMSLEGTWADHIIIQAVADALNLRIHIIESSDNFRDMSLVEAVNTTNNQRSIYIAHISEIHYISTCSEFSERNSNQIDIGDLCIDSCKSTESIQKRKCSSNTTEYKKKRLSENGINSENAYNTIGECQTSKTKKKKEQTASFMRQYRAAKSSVEEKERQRINKKNYRASKTSMENKEKHNEYEKHYGASKRSAEQKAKNNE